MASMIQSASKTYKFLVGENKNRLAVVFILFAIALSWSNVLDGYAEDYIDDSIANAGIIYGVARGINATVSVAQTAQFGVGLSVTIGELLDPINDLVERFSEVMTFSIASLALQKILLFIVQNWIFNVLLTLSGIGVLASLVFKRRQSQALKLFAILIIVRLSLSFVLIANSIVDTIFLEAQIEEGQQEINSLEMSVSAIAVSAKSKSSPEGNQNDPAIEGIDKQIGDLESKRKTVEEEIEGVKSKIEAIDVEMRQLPRPSIWCLWCKDSAEVQEKQHQIEAYKEEISEKEGALEDIEVHLEALADQRKCVQEKGNSCSSWWDLPGKISNVTNLVGDKIGGVLTLMALVVLRSILLPLFFWFVIYKTIKWIWKKEFGFAQLA